ncbi:MAG TPA: LiaF domain-containing protein [Roseiflexaceae bacterium]|nr:LiaF domain-containing protein [Roseiflexaceae bacterium]
MSATDTAMERPPRRGSLAGAAILVTLGVVLLLNNLGYLGWGVWETFAHLWPVLLIAIGLDLMIGRRSILGSALVALLVLIAFGIAIWWTGFWLPTGMAVTSEAISQPLGAARRGDIDIGMGAGRLHVGALSETDNLIEGTIARASGEQVLRDFALSGDLAMFKLRSQAAWAFPFREQRGERVEWNLLLNRAVPLRVQIDTGAGQATLELARLQVVSLDVNTGVGQTTLTLPQQGQVQARVNGGIGETVVIIPASMAARIEATTGLGQVHVVGNYQREGKVSISPGYQSAANRVELIVNGGIGSITIQQESGR